MSVTIILVHGRSQQFANRIELETRFENALLAGLAAARVTQLPSREQMLFPFYGDLFENFSLALDRPVTIQEKKERLEFERDIGQRIKAKMEARGIAPLPPEEGAAAGLAALLIEACPDATAQQVQTAIFQSCSRPTTMSRSRANRGAPDGLQALAILRSLPGVHAQPAKPVHPALTGFVPTGAAAPTDTPDGGEPERPQRGRAAKQKRVARRTRLGDTPF